MHAFFANKKIIKKSSSCLIYLSIVTDGRTYHSYRHSQQQITLRNVLMLPHILVFISCKFVFSSAATLNLESSRMLKWEY